MALFNLVIDHTKVPGDLTDYVVYINLADMPASFWSGVTSGGGDIRVFKDDGTTELAREVVSCDTGAETGELYVKYTGTLSSSIDTTIIIQIDGTSSDYSVSDTYGRNNVWSAYIAVWHMQETSGNITSSTGNNTGTDNNTVGSGTGQIGNGRNFLRSSSENFSIASGSQTGLGVTGNAITMSCWVKGDATLNNQIGRIFWRLGGTGSYGYQLSTSGAAYSPNNAYAISAVGTGGGWDHGFGTAGDATSGTLKHVAATYNGTVFAGYVNTSKTTSATKSNHLTSANAQTFYIGTSGGGDYYDDILDECRIKATVDSDNWITTDYNNQSSSSTFYSVSEVDTGETVDTNDSITISESTTVQNNIDLSVFDSISIVDIISGITRVFDVSTSDSVSITEDLQQTKVIEVSTSDSITIAESTSLEKTLYQSLFEAISITENSTQELFLSISNVNDSIGISENISTVVDILLSLFESIQITEDVTASTQLEPFETITISESVTVEFDALFISVNDALFITENIESYSFTELNLFDDISINESIESQIVYVITLNDYISITENIETYAYISSIQLPGDRGRGSSKKINMKYGGYI